MLSCVWVGWVMEVWAVLRILAFLSGGPNLGAGVL